MTRDLISKDNESTALAVSRYAALSMDRAELAATVGENLGGEQLQTSDFTRVRVPSGGASTWEYDSIEGTTSTKELTGIVIHTNFQRAYWSGAFEGAGTLPQCYSTDAETGIGDPGGDCSECPFAQWDSAPGSRGQACKLTRRLFLMTEDSLLPLLLICPPGSLKTIKQYFIGLASKALPFTSVETGLSLTREVNAQGISFARIKPRLIRTLDHDAALKARDYADMIKPVLQATTIDVVARETAENV